MPISTSPNSSKFNQFALKASGKIHSDASLTKGFNIASVTSGGAGNYVVTFTTPMLANWYIVDVIPVGNVPVQFNWNYSTGLMTTGFTIQCVSNATAYAMPIYIAVYE